MDLAESLILYMYHSELFLIDNTILFRESADSVKEIYTLTYSYSKCQIVNGSVNVNGVFSDLQSIQFGIPQGSILEPVLFTVYINTV